MAGTYALSEYLQTTTHPVLVEQRQQTPPEEYQAYLAALAPLETPRHLMLERDAHSHGAKTVTLETKPVDTGRILTAFGGSMARKEAERNTRYG
jgi:hypothetical protein